MKLRTLSLDEETDEILMQRAGLVDGNISRAARELFREAQGNNRGLRHLLRGMISGILLNSRLVRTGIQTPGVLGFVAQIENEAKAIEQTLAKRDGDSSS